MLHFHATKKLLNVCHIRPVLYVSHPMPGQLLKDWYVSLIGSGFLGKMLMLYVHEPSLLTVVVKGKTIASTVEQFRSRLWDLLLREGFPADFIERESSYASEFVVGKTNSKSMLGHINQMILQVETYNLRFPSYEHIDLSRHEDLFMDWLFRFKGRINYMTCREYWTNILG